MRKVLVLGTTVASVVAMAMAAAPANAVDGTTTVSLSVLDGTLAIATTAAAPAASSAIVGTGRVVTAPLGTTTITDTRAASVGWTMSATTTPFTPVVSLADLTPVVDGVAIPATAAKFSLQAAPITLVGTGVTYSYRDTPESTNPLAKATASGINTATVIPVLTVDVPGTAATGLYTGTVTQSVV